MVPVIFVISPALVWQGEPVEILLAFISAAAGVWMGTAAFMGYLVRPMGGLVRIGFMIAAVALLIPSSAFAGAGWLEISGAILAVVLMATEVMGKRVAQPG